MIKPLCERGSALMDLYHDIRVDTISVVVKKEEPSTFIFHCHHRMADGFIIVLDGDGIYADASGEYPIKRHSIMLLQAGEAYMTKAGKNGMTYITTAFRMRPTNAFRELGLPACTTTEKYPYILKQAEKVLSTWEERSQWYLMETRLAIEQLLIDLVSILDQPVPGMQSKGRLAPALAYINQNYDKPISNETLAQLCDLSMTHFRRLFHKQTGLSPLQYRESIRLHWAIKLLESQMFTVAEVAEQLGYSDIYHFSKVMKRHTGNTPSFYKK